MDDNREVTSGDDDRDVTEPVDGREVIEPLDDREVIEPVDRPGEPAMSHLAPVMLALVEAGNDVVLRNTNFGFVPAPHGWTAELARPIDFDLIEARFVLPDTVTLDREGDRIWDEGNQAVVLGAVAAVRSREVAERARDESAREDS